MELLNIIISILAGIGGVSGIIALYNAKSHKTTIDISNFHALLEEERLERSNLREEFDNYKTEVQTRVAEVKKEIADIKASNDVMKIAIHSAYRCPLIKEIDECIVIQTHNKLGSCEECNISNN